MKTSIKDIIIKAYTFAEDAHDGVFRKFSNLPYFTHVKFVARTLEKLNLDEEIIAAGFLHDTIEDTSITFKQIETMFGPRVATIVLEVTSVKEDMKKAGGKRLYLAEKVVSMSDDALVVKLADRFHNVLFLEQDSTPKEFIKKYYKETRFIIESLENTERTYTNVHKALIKRIDAILEFLKIRYEL